MISYFKLETIIKELERLEEQAFWGEFVVIFQEGKMVVAHINETVKPNNGTQEGVFRERGHISLSDGNS